VHDIECCPLEVVRCGRTCHPEAHVCREPAVCTGDYDCDPGRYCLIDEGTGEGICRDLCTAPGAGACPPDKPECDQHTGRCGDSTECHVGGCPPEARRIDGRCVGWECERDEDCAALGFGPACGVTCEHLPNGGTVCMEPRTCPRQGQAGCCRHDRLCDVDPLAGLDYVHCQPPCPDRPAPACPDDFQCDAGYGNLCAHVDGPGCMTAETCPDDLVCAHDLPLPACVPCPEPPCCRADADCPGPLRCDPAAGGCHECLTLEDCLAAGNGMACGDAPGGEHRLCLEQTHRFCNGDADCLGARTCEAGFCAPGPCADDRLHLAPHPAARPERGDPPGNHTPVSAAPVGPRTLTGLVFCDGRDDWFSVRVEAGSDLEALVTFDPNGDELADLGLELYRGSVLLARPDGLGGSERVTLPDAAQADDLLLRVHGRPGVRAPYQLRVRTSDL